MLQTIEKVGLRWLLRFRKLDMSQPEQRLALLCEQLCGAGYSERCS